MTEGLKCPNCEGTEFVKAGRKLLSGKVKQRLQCKNCGRYIHVDLPKEEDE